MNEITAHINQIKRLCSQYRVKSLFAFGSAVKNKLTPESDIDFIVDIDATNPFDYSDNYFDLKFHLQKLFNRNIDLLEQKSLHNPFLKQEIDQSKLLVYGK